MLDSAIGPLTKLEAAYSDSDHVVRRGTASIDLALVVNNVGHSVAYLALKTVRHISRKIRPLVLSWGLFQGVSERGLQLLRMGLRRANS